MSPANHQNLTPVHPPLAAQLLRDQSRLFPWASYSLVWTCLSEGRVEVPFHLLMYGGDQLYYGGIIIIREPQAGVRRSRAGKGTIG